MQNKLEELTEKIYQESVVKGRQEADLLIEKARLESDSMLKKAREEALLIISEAKNQACEIHDSSLAETQMAMRQMINGLKLQITELICTRLVAPVKEPFNDKEFLAGIIEAVVLGWNDESTRNPSLEVLLPAAKQTELNMYFESRLHQLLAQKITITFSDQIKAGFEIGPSDKSYKLSFTETDFENLFKEYARPRVISKLFNKA